MDLPYNINYVTPRVKSNLLPHVSSHFCPLALSIWLSVSVVMIAMGNACETVLSWTVQVVPVTYWNTFNLVLVYWLYSLGLIIFLLCSLSPFEQLDALSRAWPIAQLPDCPDVYCPDWENSRLWEQQIVNVTDCLLKCLVYRGGGKAGQFIKVNYHIQSRHGIRIIQQNYNLVSSKTDIPPKLE